MLPAPCVWGPLVIRKDCLFAAVGGLAPGAAATLAAKVAAAPGASPPTAANRQSLRITSGPQTQGAGNMPRNPFFREFDGWWDAQLRVGGKRKQIKFVRGRENQQAAYRAFCRLLADTESEIPKAQSLTADLTSITFSTTRSGTTSRNRSSSTATTSTTSVASTDEG